MNGNRVVIQREGGTLLLTLTGLSSSDRYPGKLGFSLLSDIKVCKSSTCSSPDSVRTTCPAIIVLHWFIAEANIYKQKYKATTDTQYYGIIYTELPLLQWFDSNFYCAFTSLGNTSSIVGNYYKYKVRNSKPFLFYCECTLEETTMIPK